jgi:hypothetical protein
MGNKFIHMRGPSAREIPSAFPPFLLKCEMISVVNGWNTQAGVMFANALISSTSSMKIETISDTSVALFLIVRVQYVSLTESSVMPKSYNIEIRTNTYRKPIGLDSSNPRTS